MALGLRFFSRYKDTSGVVKELRFYKVDYVGSVTEWFNSYGSCDIEQGTGDSMFGDPIVTSRARIHLTLMEHYDLTEFVYDRKTFFVQKVVPNDSDPLLDEIEWSGWIEPWDASRPYQKPPYNVNITASCGLAHLAKKKYVNPNNIFKKTGLTILQDCLGIIESDLNLRVSTHMYENSWTGDPEYGLNSFEINTARYYDENGEAMKCDEIVRDILNKFNAELTQWANRWVVRAIVDNATGFDRSFIEIPFAGGSPAPARPWPNTYLINDSEAFTTQGGVISILAPITKYRTEVDLGDQIPYFENGNMVLWTEDGLVGWDFSHMPKGSPGWSRDYLGGDPDNASVLKISGKSPGPYEKKRKKTLGEIIGKLVMPLTFNTNRKTLHIEPSEWIESSVGRVSPGDKKITISFDYETEPFSSNIIIALRFPSATNPAITYWSQPFQENVPASKEYKWILVPPIDREGVIGRGHIDVSGNPNYPDGNVPGWTYVIFGIPAGQTRRIGGPGGVIVENDDIIISKISNPGGTQAAVGASWEVINIRVNIQKGTFEIPIDFTAANEKMPIPVEEIYIRFYKITQHPDKTGDWYKIHNLKGTIEGFVAKDDASQYATTLERGSKTDEEAETIQLITGDYNPWYSGSMTLPGSIENTKSWRRRPGLNESLSIYRAMMLDRLCLTSRPLTVLEGSIFLMYGSAELSYFHSLILADKSNMRMRIVAYSYNEYTRIARITAVEVKYEDIPESELRQDSYIPGSRLLNPVSGQGDGIYPTKQDSSSGRLNAEELEPTAEEIAEAIGNSSGRMSAVFDVTTPLTYVAGVTSTDSINLLDFVTEAFTEINEEQEPEDQFDLQTLEFSIIEKPSWVDPTIVFLVVEAEATAPESGQFFILYEITYPESGAVFSLRVPILVTPSEDFAESWPPVFENIELKFTVGETSTQTAIIANYMDEEHGLAIGYTYRVITPISWVTGQAVVFGDLSVIGKPSEVGSTLMAWEIKDSIGRTHIFFVTLIVMSKATVIAEVPGIGSLSGSYEVPVEFNVEFTIDGPHSGYEVSINGGGALGTHVSFSDSNVFDEVSVGTYLVFPADIPAETGQYEIKVWVRRNDTISEQEVFGLTFYDEEYFSYLRSVYISAGVDIDYLSFEGDSTFENDGVEIWNLATETDGVSHDVMKMELLGETGPVLKTTTHFLEDPATDGRYLLDVSPIARDAGKYRIRNTMQLGATVLMIRTFEFEVIAKDDENGCCEGYAANFGNGVDTNYILTHGLNSKDLHVSFLRNGDRKSIDLAWKVLDMNRIEIGCSARAIPLANYYRAQIEKN